MLSLVDSLKVARRGRGLGGGETIHAMRGTATIKKQQRTRQAELNKEKLEKIGRALAVDKVAFDFEMKRRREEEAAQTQIASSMGFKTVEQMKEEGMKVELRNSSEVLERVALQTLNKSFAKRLIAQRHTLTALDYEKSALQLEFSLLTQHAQEDDAKWKTEALDSRVIRWNREENHVRDLMAKAKHKLDLLQERINKDRSMCTLSNQIIAEARADIATRTKHLDLMTAQVLEDHKTIGEAEISIKKISSELAVEVNLFKNGYKSKRSVFEMHQRHHKERTFEEVLNDYSDDKITPEARRMMLKAAAENAKLKRGRDLLHHNQKKLKQFNTFFTALKGGTGIDDIGEIVVEIVKDEERKLDMIKVQTQLETEISDHMKALTKTKRLQMEEFASGSSAKVLARQRQAKQVQVRVAQVEQKTSKHTNALEGDRKVLNSITKGILDILFLVKPSSQTRLKKFAKQHGDTGNEVIIVESLGEVDLWITTMLRILTENQTSMASWSKDQRKRRGSVLLPSATSKFSYIPRTGAQRAEDALKRKKGRFSKPQAPDVNFFGLKIPEEDRPNTIQQMKEQVQQMVAENKHHQNYLGKEHPRQRENSRPQMRRSSLHVDRKMMPSKAAARRSSMQSFRGKGYDKSEIN